MKKEVFCGFPYGCNMSFRKRALQEIGGFDEKLSPQYMPLMKLIWDFESINDGKTQFYFLLRHLYIIVDTKEEGPEMILPLRIFLTVSNLIMDIF